MEGCSVTPNSDGSIQVTLSPSAVQAGLQGRLSPEDIEIGMDIVENMRVHSQIQTELFNGCVNTRCRICNQTPFRVFPNGNTKANVMFLNNRPTQYEAYMGMSHCDKASVFLSLILNKMGVARSDVYCTTVEKCPGNNESDVCISFYLRKEIDLVRPKVIVCNGLSLLKKLEASGIIEGLPADKGYGMIYNVIVRTNVPNPPATIQTKIIAIYELDKVLQKGDDEYKQVKDALWGQLLTAFKASVGG